MKKMSLFFAGFFVLLLSFNASAQSKTGAHYFKGKWSILVKGTPGGDSKMFFVLESKNDSIVGIVQDSTGTEISKISSVELKDTSATVYFSTQGYYVNVVMNKKDDDHVKGRLMDMFDTDGERIKEAKKD
jgi:hypothetical protein